MISVLLVLTLTVALSGVTPHSFATGYDSVVENGNITLGEIQQILIQYLDASETAIEPGTEDYYNYIVDQLLNHTDLELLNHENYPFIHAYMAEFKVAYEDYLLYKESNNEESIGELGRISNYISYDTGTKSAVFSLSTEFLSKTINDIIFANNNGSDKIQSIEKSVVSTSYSGIAAAEYAIKHATSYNSEYPSYSADCTNFVSQCLLAGGIVLDGTNTKAGIFDSTTEWYCIYINSILGFKRYAVTTSWIRVVDFDRYISNISTRFTVESISELITVCKVGDIVQLADKMTGTAYHSIIISKKDTSTAYFCGHSNDRENADVNNYLDDSSDTFILFQFA